jgi:hypothetical protein
MARKNSRHYFLEGCATATYVMRLPYLFCGVRLVVWAVWRGGCALYCKLWFVLGLARLEIVSVLGWFLWSFGVSRTNGEFFVHPKCVIYGRSKSVYKSNGQTVAAVELVSTVNGLTSTVSDFLSTVSGLRFHDGHLRFHESDFLRPPVSFSFP